MKVSPLIIKQDTIKRDSIAPQQCLAVTLRFLATRESFTSLEFHFMISRSTLSMLIPTVCQAIYQVLCHEYFKCPSTSEEWLMIAKVFEDRWNLPNRIGAGDGKHIRMKDAHQILDQTFTTTSNFSAVFFRHMLVHNTSSYILMLVVKVVLAIQAYSGGQHCGKQLKQTPSTYHHQDLYRNLTAEQRIFNH